MGGNDTYAPEMIVSRANADHENMGLTAWKGERVTQADSDVAKNYLVEGEIRELNRLTTILLDIFEDQLDIGRISTMAEIQALLQAQLTSLGRQVLSGGGSVKTVDAKAYAISQSSTKNEEQYGMLRRTLAIAALKEQEKMLPKPPRRKPGKAAS